MEGPSFPSRTRVILPRHPPKSAQRLPYGNHCHSNAEGASSPSLPMRDPVVSVIGQRGILTPLWGFHPGDSPSSQAASRQSA